MTNDLINTGNPGEASAKKPTDTDNGLYMYERTKPTRTGEQTGIIVKLKWSADLEEDHPNYGDRGQSRYYKIEVLDKEGEYMPICRNVLYTSNLAHLSGDGEEYFDIPDADQLSFRYLTNEENVNYKWKVQVILTSEK